MSLKCLLAIAAISSIALAAQTSESLLQRLGYPPGTKLVILHGDDLGEWEGVNAASIRALEAGRLTSVSMMAPCPWFPEIAAYSAAHPEADFGLHLTVTSERTAVRWGPVASKDRVPSLLDPMGYLRKDAVEAAGAIRPEEAEIEIRAQLDRARAMGTHLTHIESHQGILFTSRPLFEMLLRVGRDYHLPVVVAREGFEWYDIVKPDLTPDMIVLDRQITIPRGIANDKWLDWYADAIRSIKPGVTTLVVHVAFANEETKAATADRPTWGAEWRQRDYDAIMSARFKQLLDDNGIRLTTWKELTERAKR